MDMEDTMQSPFPGMDPYLENPDLWRDVHNSLIYTIRAILVPQLPAGFSARLEEALYIALRPDVSLLIEQETEEVVRWIAIRELRENTLVTAIEVLSITNKERGPGRDKYLRKRRRFMNASVNVLEVDLLRSGPYTLGAPQARLKEKCPRWDYLVTLYRASEPELFPTWPRTLRERLPVVNVPLLPEYEDLSLDLQAALDRAYEEGGFERSLNYTQPPPMPSLSPEDTHWLDALLHEKGFRSKGMRTDGEL
jgi:hypothetical protein